MRVMAVAAALALGAGWLMARVSAAAADAKAVPPPGQTMPAAKGLQTVVLSGGCFWGVQGVFEHVQGVERAVAGYAGGTKDTADYETVSSGTTGHAESVQVTYDPSKISFGHLLQIFFSVVLDPTEVNRQGPDEGTQYRSEIFVTNADQAALARAYILQLDAARVFDGKIATRVEELPAFYPAEAYHQDFLVTHPDYPYIVYNDLPKVAALKAAFPKDYRETARLSGTKS
jgi:peptide-methionine (S)-S-oxide reductase